MFYGLVTAIVVGIPLGVLMARIRWLDWALDLPINALYATPLVAVVPLLVLWFGIYLKSQDHRRLPVRGSPHPDDAYRGVRECDKEVIEVAQSFRSSNWRIWRDLLLPFAVPYIIAGLRLAIGRVLIGTIIAEFSATIADLNFMITKYTTSSRWIKRSCPDHSDGPGRLVDHVAEIGRPPHRALERRNR